MNGDEKKGIFKLEKGWKRKKIWTNIFINEKIFATFKIKLVFIICYGNHFFAVDSWNYKIRGQIFAIFILSQEPI